MGKEPGQKREVAGAEGNGGDAGDLGCFNGLVELAKAQDILARDFL